MITEKLCSKCNVIKPVNEFGRASGGKYLRPECKQCGYELNRVVKEMKKTIPIPSSDHLCPICLRNEDQVRGKGSHRSGPWCCDHDHEQKTFRDWICHDCNRALGNFKDRIDLIESALSYLKKHKNV